ncbi:MAG TPA: hypothetical protein VF054_15390 [Micromonosporaceae bacterium]
MESDGDVTARNRARDDASARGRGRSSSRRLAVMISVRFGADEADLVRAAAANAGQSVSNFLRAAALRRAGAPDAAVAAPSGTFTPPATTFTRGGPAMSVASDGSFIAGDPRLTA